MSAYGTKTQAQQYFMNKLRTYDWDVASDVDRDKALNEAVTLIDSLNFAGDMTSPTQPNQFPRGGDTVIPVGIMYACFETALKLLEGFDPDREAKNVNISESRFATTMTKRDATQNPPPWVMAGIPSQTAWNYLKPFLRDPLELDLTRTN